MVTSASLGSVSSTQGLIGVGGDDDAVHVGKVTCDITDLHALFAAGDVRDGVGLTDVRQHRSEAADIGAGAAGDGVPLR